MRRARGPRCWFRGLFLVLALHPRPARANPDTLRGVGLRSQALAAANVADVDDAASVLENPAGVARAPGTLLSLGFAFTSYALEADGVRAPLEDVRSVELGVVVPGHVRGVPVGFGLHLALPDGRLSKLHQVRATDAYFPLDDAGPRLLNLGTVVAVTPFRGLSIGGGVGFLASLDGGFEVTGTAVVADGTGSEYGSSLAHGVDAELRATRYAIAGLRYDAGDLLSAALSYRAAARVHQHVEGRLDGDLALGPVRIPLEYAFTTDAIVAYHPAQLVAALTLRPGADVTAHAALAWQRYSGYASPYARTTTHVTTALPPGLTLPLPPDEPGSDPPAARLSNRFVPRLGAERAFHPWPRLAVTARAGYAFEHSPVPAHQVDTLLFDSDRHVLGVGAGLAAHEPSNSLREIPPGPRPRGRARRRARLPDRGRGRRFDAPGCGQPVVDGSGARPGLRRRFRVEGRDR